MMMMTMMMMKLTIRVLHLKAMEMTMMTVVVERVGSVNTVAAHHHAA